MKWRKYYDHSVYLKLIEFVLYLYSNELQFECISSHMCLENVFNGLWIHLWKLVAAWKEKGAFLKINDG